MTSLLFSTATQPSHMSEPSFILLHALWQGLVKLSKGSGARKDCCLSPSPTSYLHLSSSVLENSLSELNIWNERKDKLFHCQKRQGNFSDVNKLLTTNVNSLRGEFNRTHTCPEGEWSYQWVIRLSESLSVSGTLWLEFGQSWIRVLVEEFTTGRKKNNQAQNSLKTALTDDVQAKQILNLHTSRTINTQYCQKYQPHYSF